MGTKAVSGQQPQQLGSHTRGTTMWYAGPNPSSSAGKEKQELTL